MALEDQPASPLTRSMCIGGAGVRLVDPAGKQIPNTGEFISASDGPGDQLTLEVLHTPAPDPGKLELVFDSTSLWKVYRQDTAYVLVLPHLSAVVDFDSRTGRIHLPDDQGPAFDYPLDEAIFSKLLADRGSVIVHACGVEHRGRGILLAGASGAGKSTVAKLFDASPESAVLGDDRIVMGCSTDGFHISGTPWHGTAGYARNRTVPLRHLFFLRHAPEQTHRVLRATEAAAQLMSLCVIPYWHRESSHRSIDAVVSAAERIETTELGLTPLPSAMDFILGLL